MRTIVRALAIMAVLGTGLLLLGGAAVTLLQRGEEETPRQDSAGARARSWIGKVKQNESVAFLGGELFISVVKVFRDEAVTIVLSSPGRPSRTYEAQHVGEAVVYDDGRGGSEVRPTAIGILDAEFLVVPRAQLPTVLDQVLEEERARESARDLRLGGVPLSIAGFVLTISGIILAAVRPRQRQVVARPVLGNAAVLASMAQARPAVAPVPGPMREAQAPPSQPAAPTFQRDMPVPVAPKPHSVKTSLWAVGIALIGIGLVVSLFGTSQHSPQISSRPGSYTEHGFYSSSRGDAAPIIAGGVVLVITGAGLVVVAQFLRRGETPKP
jgi:uncharacterized membrane protein